MDFRFGSNFRTCLCVVAPWQRIYGSVVHCSGFDVLCWSFSFIWITSRITNTHTYAIWYGIQPHVYDSFISFVDPLLVFLHNTYTILIPVPLLSTRHLQMYHNNSCVTLFYMTNENCQPKIIKFSTPKKDTLPLKPYMCWLTSFSFRCCCCC